MNRQSHVPLGCDTTFYLGVLTCDSTNTIAPNTRSNSRGAIFFPNK